MNNKIFQPVWMFRIVLLLILLAIANGLTAQDKRSDHAGKRILKRTQFVPEMFAPWKHIGNFTVDSIELNKESHSVVFFLNQTFTQIPIRTETEDNLKKYLTAHIQKRYRNFELLFQLKGKSLQEYIPNAFRDSLHRDISRMIPAFHGIPLIKKAGQNNYAGGLSGNHIALWPSHGYFFDQQLDRWQWQRARLWQTVEDIFPFSFTTEYLAPMLENAGAVVVMPRERDFQTNEVIVDNDGSTGKSALLVHNAETAISEGGFKWSDTLFTAQNPFCDGSFITINSARFDSFSIEYIPDMPAESDYAVYVSYAPASQCVTDVQYEVFYAGGKALFSVNQCMGAGTWIYLGTFRFSEGFHADSGSVRVSGGDHQGIITADAVRFGGGMGNVARKPVGSDFSYRYKISGKPRWMEAARYYLQYAGMPDSIVYSLNKGTSDYNDDYMSRGEWVNYLIGNAKPQFSDKYAKGLGIPIDIALAFHTDAGVAGGDSIIGTLGIYSTTRNNGVFPDGTSRMACRDLTDIIQTSLVADIRNHANAGWTRRGMWDKEYSEAWRPAIPAMLLELQSHQNLADMKFGLDPRYKFLAARAVYKGILKYLKSQTNEKYVVQPLPPDHLAIQNMGDLKIRLSWKAVTDSLESSAVPYAFKVYRRSDHQGFDQGTITSDTMMIIDLPAWNEIYSFSVTAMNDGGESFPGETLSVSLKDDQRSPVLIVNAFDRISGPAFFDRGDMGGIAWWEDEGVPYKRDFSFTGYQYDFDRRSEWIHDDKQGWGASHSDMEAVQITGNTFDFPYIHGKALQNAGYSFISVSDEFFASQQWNAKEYPVADIIFGEERRSGLVQMSGDDFAVFSPGMIRALDNYIITGGNVLASGSYIGSDMVNNRDSEAVNFAADMLHYSWRTGHAATVGKVLATDRGRLLFPDSITFNTANGKGMYRVESPDGIEPSGKDAFRIYRYASGNVSAGVAYEGSYKTVILGFPFETITGSENRNELMKRIMNFFNE